MGSRAYTLYSQSLRDLELFLTLVMMGGLQTLVLMGTLSPPPFLFVKTIEKVIRLCTVLKKKYLIGSFKDKAIFHVILEIDR